MIEGQLSMLEQCKECESGGFQCEVWITSQEQPHEHWISEATITGDPDDIYIVNPQWRSR